MTAKSETSPPSLKDVSTHFAFGQNWASYAGIIDEARIGEAGRGLVRLLGEGGLAGKSLLDIGCGSGLHAVAAARLGAARIVAVDLDPIAIKTARAVLRQHAPSAASNVRELSVFDIAPDTFGRFDVVYS